MQRKQEGQKKYGERKNVWPQALYARKMTDLAVDTGSGSKPMDSEEQQEDYQPIGDVQSSIPGDTVAHEEEEIAVGLLDKAVSTSSLGEDTMMLGDQVKSGIDYVSPLVHSFKEIVIAGSNRKMKTPKRELALVGASIKKRFLVSLASPASKGSSRSHGLQEKKGSKMASVRRQGKVALPKPTA